MSLPRTPSQTVGPFLAIGMRWEDGAFVTPAGTPGSFWIRGRVYDGAGDPVPDAVVETWQADPFGAFPTSGTGFRGFGRSATDGEGRWEILTLKPGRVAGRDGSPRPPHIEVQVFARGLLKQVFTRLYFGDEEEANAADPFLCTIDPARRATLIAEPAEDGYRLDFHLQGPRETVFFRV